MHADADNLTGYSVGAKHVFPALRTIINTMEIRTIVTNDVAGRTTQHRKLPRKAEAHGTLEDFMNFDLKITHDDGTIKIQ